MGKKRIIPCLDLKNGRVVKGVNFVNLRDAGDALACAKEYDNAGADELAMLDIAASGNTLKGFLDIIRQVSNAISIPLTVGGGVISTEVALQMLLAGASKVSVGSAGIQNPELLSDISKEIGKERLICAMDVKSVDGTFYVVINGGKTVTDTQATAWAKKVQELGVGEILLTSMDKDGDKSGYDLEITRAIAESVNIPVIASGGAGKKEDFYTALTQGKADAALAASLFHFGELKIPELKEYLKEKGLTFVK